MTYDVASTLYKRHVPAGQLQCIYFNDKTDFATLYSESKNKMRLVFRLESVPLRPPTACMILIAFFSIFSQHHRSILGIHFNFLPLNVKTTMISTLGPTVQSVVSLTSSLRVVSLTVLADSIYNILIFLLKKCE